MKGHLADDVIGQQLWRHVGDGAAGARLDDRALHFAGKAKVRHLCREAM